MVVSFSSRFVFSKFWSSFKLFNFPNSDASNIANNMLFANKSILNSMSTQDLLLGRKKPLDSMDPSTLGQKLELLESKTKKTKNLRNVARQ